MNEMREKNFPFYYSLRGFLLISEDISQMGQNKELRDRN